jgi:hypothetical protein
MERSVSILRLLLPSAAWLLTPALLLAQEAHNDSTPPKCASRGMATVALGDALGNVRAARVFADETPRRQALADIEILLVSQIQAESTSTFRRAAWNFADSRSYTDPAQAWRANAERFADGAPSKALHDETLQKTLTSWYRHHLEEVVRLLSPSYSFPPPACATEQWTAIRSQALRADAL